MNQLDGQPLLARAESPVTTIIITTTSHQPSLASTSIHASAAPSNPQLMNGLYNGNKCGNIMMEQQQSKNRICRDFVRGSCRRLYCKYPHVSSPDLVVFCHDYQNNKCPRVNCKFLHFSIEDEDHYRKYGEFPIGNGQDDYNSNQNMNSNGNIQQVEYQGEYDYKTFFSNSNSNANRSLPSLLDSDIFQSCQNRMDCSILHNCINDRNFSNGANVVYRNGLKRMSSQDRDQHFMQQQQQKFKRCREDDIMTILRRFEEEHQMLKRRVEANELKIAELRASNEYLMTQNAQLRLSTVQVSRVVNPVTVTSTVTQSQQQAQATQVINASMAPVQVATPIVSMTTPQTILAQTQNLSGAPIAISNTTQTGQQILGTSQITLAPALAPSISAPSIGLSINTSQALAAISNANQPIISYPIMTHSILPH